MSTKAAIEAVIESRDTIWTIVQLAHSPFRAWLGVLKKLNASLETLVTEQNGFSAERVEEELRRIRLCAVLAHANGAAAQNDPLPPADAALSIPPPGFVAVAPVFTEYGS